MQTFKKKFPEDGIALGIVLFLDYLEAIAVHSTFLGVFDANKGETCEQLDNTTSLRIEQEVLNSYFRETRRSGRGAIAAFLLLLLPLVFLLVAVAVMYLKSIFQSSSSSRSDHYSPLVTLFSCCCCCDKNLGDHSHMSYLACLIEFLLAIIYFVSDNLGHITSNYGNDIGCDLQCSHSVAIVTKAASVGSILLLHMVPYILHHMVELADTDDWEYEMDNEQRLLTLLGNIVKVDAAYTAISVTGQVSYHCGSTENGLNWAVLVMASVFGTAFMVAKIATYYEFLSNYWNNILVVSVTAGPFFFALLFIYLLSDNATPLDCWFDCYSGSPDYRELATIVLTRHCCDIRRNVVARLVMTFIAASLTTIAAIFMGLLPCGTY